MERIDETFARLIMSTRNPQGQLSALNVKIGGEFIPLKETGWPIKDLEAAGQSIEVTAPGQQEAKDAVADIRKENPDLQITQSKMKIHITFAIVTGDYIEEQLQKVTKTKEKYRIHIRDVRAKAIKDLKKVGYSKSEDAQWTKKIQAAHDKYIKQIDTVFANMSKKLKNM